MARPPVHFPDPPGRSAAAARRRLSDAMHHTYRSDLSQVRALVLQQARAAAASAEEQG